jgi:hypothetical protein
MTQIAHQNTSRPSGRCAALALLFLSLLAGCGAVSSPSSSNGGASNSGALAASSTATAGASGSSTLNGCVTVQAPAAASSAADVTVRQVGSETGKPVALKKGQTLEILLPAAYRWRLGTSNLGATLTEVGSGGWYDAATKSCAWRFTGANTGTIPLDFGGSPVCAPGTKCPAIELEVSYTVTVA